MSKDPLLNLKRALRAFDKDGLFTHALPILNVASKRDILNEISRLRLKCNTVDIVNVLLDIVKSKYSKQELIQLVLFCQLHGIAYQSKRIKWNSVRFSEEESGDNDSITTPEDFSVEFKRSLMRNDIRADVKTIFQDDVFWVSVIEKKIIKKHLKELSPIFFAWFQGQPFVFWCKRSPSVTALMAFAEVCNFKDFHKINLTGHDVKDMLQILTSKGKRPGAALEATLPNSIKETSLGIDASQFDNRKKYVDRLFGPNPPKVSNYTVETENIPWQGKHNYTKLKTVTISATLELQTTDSIQMLKEFAMNGVLKLPPPPYVSNILNCGKNYVKLKAKRNIASQSDIDDL